MRKKALLALFIFIISMSAVSATLLFDYQCAHKDCMEGTEVNFTIHIRNNLGKIIHIESLHMKDKYSNQILGISEEEVTLIPNAEMTFEISSDIPTPYNSTYTFYTVPCFYVRIYNESGHQTHRGELCKREPKAIPTIPLSKVECQTDEECDPGYYCNIFSLYQCVSLDECNPETGNNCDNGNPGITGAVIGLVKDNPIIFLVIVGFLAIVGLFLYRRSLSKEYSEEPIVDDGPKKDSEPEE